MATEPVSVARQLHRRRVRRVTAGIAACAAAATAVFAAAAAHTTRSASAGDGVLDPVAASTSSEDGESQSFLAPSQSSPSQSFGPPVARSGGS